MKNLKKVLGFGLALALSVSLVGCGAKDKDTADNQTAKTKLEQIKKSGKLVVATSADFPPFDWVKMVDGKEKVVGFDSALAEEIGKEIGVKVEFVNMDFSGLLGAINANKADMILAGMQANDERRKSVDFSDVYHDGQNAVVVKKGKEDKVKTEDDLKKLKIGVQSGTIQEKYVKDTLKAENVTSLGKTTDLMLELQNGKADAAVIAGIPAKINVQKYDGLAIADTNLEHGILESGSAAAFKKSTKDSDNTSLIALVNKKIKELKDSGKLEQILDDSIKEIEK